jgi:hypothetical protein
MHASPHMRAGVSLLVSHHLRSRVEWRIGLDVLAANSNLPTPNWQISVGSTMRKDCLRRVLDECLFKSGVYLGHPYYAEALLIFQALAGDSQVTVALDDARQIAAVAFVFADAPWVLHASDATPYQRMVNEEGLLQWLQLP